MVATQAEQPQQASHKMDPKQALRDLLATEPGSDERTDLAANLDRWLKRGGFSPVVTHNNDVWTQDYTIRAVSSDCIYLVATGQGEVLPVDRWGRNVWAHEWAGLKIKS